MHADHACRLAVHFAHVYVAAVAVRFLELEDLQGRFNLNYRGEVLSGEATRTSGDARKGVASAYGTAGSFMSCEYQMSSPLQGAGECTLSNGARYQVHISN